VNFRLLKRLTETPGISGREERVRDLVAEEFSGLDAEEMAVDALGNLIAHVPGSGPRVALAAHMDEVGFMVSKIEPEGFIRVMPAGGVDPKVFWAQKVVVHGRQDLPGVVGSVPPHLSGAEGPEVEKAVPIDSCFIDTGLPAEEVNKLIMIGDPVTFATQSWETGEAFFGKALDDRIGLFVMLESVRRATHVDCDLFLIASTQEEYGLRGIGPAVYAVKPAIALALEGTVASDTPGLTLPANVTPTALGKGPEIRLTDRRMISNRPLVDFLDLLSREAGIPHQMIVKKAGATDAAVGQVTGAGVRVGAVAVPTRYIHAPIGLVSKADVAHSITLMTRFIERVSQFDPR
jgi:putative aminopeptidase FrvX